MPLVHVATSIVRRLQEKGFIAYFAGGWVRDFLMGHPSDDIDIATSASVEHIQNLFSKTIPVGIAFGIVVVVEEGKPFEVATFRKESGYLDGRRPTQIEPTTPQEDAQRRDFTINGLFYDPLSQSLLDFVEGQKDIQKKVIRAIGNPHQRFLEDRLRMMRAVRYATRFHFRIEDHTKEAILSHAHTLRPTVAIERIWQEFKKMAQFGHFDTGLIALYELGLLSNIFPKLKDISYSEITKRVSAISHFPGDAPAIAAILDLFPHSSLEELLQLCDLLKLSRQERLFVEFSHTLQSLLNMPEDWIQKIERAQWADLYAHPLFSTCIEIFASHLHPSLRQSFLQIHLERKSTLQPFIERKITQNPLVSANDLMQEGIPPSPLLGALLREAERMAINSNLQQKEEIIKKLKEIELWPS